MVPSHTPLPRIFQWAGGKTKMMRHYAHLLPHPLHAYVEPFAGGAAVFSHLAGSRALPATTTLGDTNAEIMGLYQALANHPDALIARIAQHSQAWALLAPEERKTAYYAWRQRYWAMPEGLEATALLYALMRTSFNGIWQTCADSKGRFGTPAGLTNRKGGFMDEAALRAWSHALQGVRLRTGSYETITVPKGAFVFCDPPYRVSFTQYGTGFNDTHQAALVAWCRKVHHEHNATVWLANREAEDGFFEDHAHDATIHRFPITYTAGRRKKTDEGYAAKPATELLMVWAP